MTDEEFVRANCGDSVLDPSSEGEHIFFHVGDCAGWNFASWATAAEYVRDRLEQIRQLEEDIDRHAPMQRIPLERIANAIRESFWDEWIVDDVRELCSASRTLARLESALADLKRGMK